MNDLMDKIVSLSKRRGFIIPGSEIYGGLANSWDYGPQGVELKKNIKDLWWNTYVRSRDDIFGLDAAIIMNPKVWIASGHVAGFSDPLVECKNCHIRYRADLIDLNTECTNCSHKNWGAVKNFNLMFKTTLGPLEDVDSVAYLRPETAQGQFVDYKQITITNPHKLPFGIAQQGKAFRNEITTGNFIFRLRELEQMEIEYFIEESTWQTHFEYWRKEFWNWFEMVGIDKSKIYEHEIEESERAFYSKRTIDFEFQFPFGQKELYGLAYRTDHDLRSHMNSSKQDLNFIDNINNKKFIPHVIEPTWGVDRTILAVLLSAYKEIDDRVVLSLKPQLAPYKVALFPLVRNKPEITSKAQEIYSKLKKNIMPICFDDRGNIGKRYYAQDEIGTPFCITVDYDTLENDVVTIRDRDSAIQTKVKTENIVKYIQERI